MKPSWWRGVFKGTVLLLLSSSVVARRSRTEALVQQPLVDQIVATDYGQLIEASLEPRCITLLSHVEPQARFIHPSSPAPIDPPDTSFLGDNTSQGKEVWKINSDFINSLPSELLLDIFGTATEITSDYFSHEHRGTFMRTWRCLLLTCHHWHAEVMDDPRLWARILLFDDPRPTLDMLQIFLDRSKQADLKLYVRLLGSTPQPATIGAFHSRIHDHSSRLRLIHFSARHNLDFFPLPYPTPRLQELRLFTPVIGKTQKPEHILFSTSPLRSYRLGWIQPDPFHMIDPSNLEFLSFDTNNAWKHPLSTQFLHQLCNLKVLILPRRAMLLLPRELSALPDDPFDFPALEQLILRDPCWTVGLHFAILPNLRSLVVIQGRKFYTPGNLQTWPIMPSLRILVVDHPNAADFIPTFRTSPSLHTIHIQYEHGLVKLIQSLLMSELDSCSNREVERLTPNLHSLRLYPTLESWAGESARPASDVLGAVMASLDMLLDQRPALEVEIALPVTEEDWDYDGGYWEGQWTEENLLEYTQGMKALRNSSRVILVEDVPFADSLDIARRVHID
ncbi:hypothetical protein DL93DRAFT_2097619 [Clavulina sp. PMI_390]|nr:hypothetical protein DL93DRAFT_2097619 [Clavulina sp. PMI_390]